MPAFDARRLMRLVVGASLAAFPAVCMAGVCTLPNAATCR